MSVNVKMRQRMERKITSRLIRDGLEAGYSIAVDNGGDAYEVGPTTNRKEILAAMFATVDEHLFFYNEEGKQVGWVWLVYGNDGYDVISNYTTNLEHIMAGPNKLSDMYQ